MDGTGAGSAVLIATILMPVISMVKKPSWDTKSKYLIGMAAALFAAICGAVVDGEVKNLGELGTYFAVALGYSQTLYNLYFKDTETQQKLAEL